MRLRFFLCAISLLISCFRSNAQQTELIPNTVAPPPVEKNKTSLTDSINPNPTKIYFKAGRSSSLCRVDPPYSGTGNNFVSPAFFIGLVGKQLGKKRFFAFELEFGLVNKGVEINVTNSQFFPGSSPNAPGHTFPTSGVETIKLDYLSNACMLRFCPIDFFYLKAGLNGSIFLNNSYNQRYVSLTSGYQFGVGLQFMSRIIGGMIEVEDMRDFVPATGHSSDVVIYNRTALITAGLLT
jgi:hypothetical protein